MNRRTFFQLSGIASAASHVAAQSVTLEKPKYEGPVFKIGNIGCGSRGSFVCNIIKENPGFQIAAAADYFGSKAKVFGDTFGVPAEKQFSGLDGYKRMLEHVDAVAIHSPPYFHVQQAVDAVAAGKHVLIAKPMAIDVAGCETMRQLAKEAAAKGIVVVADVQSRADQFFQEGIERVRAGGIGDILFGECHYEADLIKCDASIDNTPEGRLTNWIRHRDLGGDIITEQNIHAVDILSWALGRPVKVSGISGRGARPDDVGDASDHYSLLFEFEKGAVSFGSRQFNGFGSAFQCGSRLVGSKGIFTCEFGGRVMIRGGKENYWAGGVSKNLYRSGSEVNVETFRKAIAEGKPAGNTTVEEAVESTLLTLIGEYAAGCDNGITWNDFIKNAKTRNPDLAGLRV